MAVDEAIQAPSTYLLPICWAKSNIYLDKNIVLKHRDNVCTFVPFLKEHLTLVLGEEPNLILCADLVS